MIPVFMTVTLPIVFDLYKRVDVFAQAAFCSEQVSAVALCRL